ncbi:hypothetical protein B5M42_006865 [Paenibacillus athensensis]|uniref:Integral membrane protein n=1 Tax=Paenibacillus athensensis TaxID=1967502 RepID=A0A4Y8PZK9_9BACL|nr:hypothetical protein [Paenibacillus athensensis]MCD1258553.1 hypothetical protein [Paenibacillus athensensis]
MKTIWNRLVRIRTAYALLLVLAAVIFNQGATLLLNDWYRRSQYPVPYYEGQLSFSAAKLTAYYRYMLDHNSLGIYFQTQCIDFVFILATFLLHGSIGLLVYKLVAHRPFLKKASLVALAAGLLAPCFDILENLVSFYFIARPEAIPAALALLYSSFSACKFGLFIVAYVLFGILLLWGVWMAICRRKRSAAL